MRDAFGVERGDEIAKFALKPVGDFIKGAASTLKLARSSPISQAGRIGAAAPGMAKTTASNLASGAGEKIGVGAGKVKSFAQNKPKTAGAIAGGVGSAGVIGGGLGFAASGRKQ